MFPVHPQPSNVPRAKNHMLVEANFFFFLQTRISIFLEEFPVARAPQSALPTPGVSLGGCMGIWTASGRTGEPREAPVWLRAAMKQPGPPFLSCLCSEIKTAVCGSPVVITTCCCVQEAHASPAGPCSHGSGVPSSPLARKPWRHRGAAQPDQAVLVHAAKKKKTKRGASERSWLLAVVSGGFRTGMSGW